MPNYMAPPINLPKAPAVPVGYPGTGYDEFGIPLSTVGPGSVIAADPNPTDVGAAQLQNPTAPNLYSQDAILQTNGNITTDYSAQVTYIRDTGMRVYPVAGLDTSGSQSGVVVQEHCPMESAVISWLAIATGAMPRVPSPVLNDQNFILVGRSISNAIPVLNMAGALPRYVVSGTYTYQMIVPGGVVRDFPGLGSTLNVIGQSQNKIPAGNFDRTLVM